MALLQGHRLSCYEILSLLGKGGMGEVYKARDTRLGRIVAIKVLPDRFSDDNARRGWFEREARMLGRLNHPHICVLHDVGSDNGAQFLVMEYLEGETLAARRQHAALRTDQALRYAAQIADALDKAHRQGVIHRDLKPANIMIEKSGNLKLLDFGLAKALASHTSDTTVTLADSAPGAMKGTVPYMSPEQLQGKEGDARSDIFALGAVLYEMLTGRRAFAGDSAASVIASIIGQEPAPISSVDHPGLDHLVNKCIAKDPEQRWQSAADLRDELLWLADQKPAVATATRNRRVLWPWAIAAIFAALALFAWIPRPGPEHLLSRVSLEAPEGTQISGFGSAISPNGRMVVFVGSTHGVRQLWVRPLETAQARKLQATEEAQFPFWSPDSQSIGFFASGRLKRVDLATSVVRSICPATNGIGGSWNADNIIVFTPFSNSALQSVSASGGTPAAATVRNSSRRDSRHNYPQFLPDGKRFLVLVGSLDPSQTGTYVGTLGKPDELLPLRELLGTPYQAIYAPSNGSATGHIIFVRDQRLWARYFDPRSLRLTGDPVPLSLRDVYASTAMPGFPGFLNVSASRDDSMLDGGSQDVAVQLLWRDRKGRLLEAIDKAGDTITPELSPNASQIVVSRPDMKTGAYDLWLMDLRRQSLSKLTFGTGRDFYPIWSPDGSRVVFSSDQDGQLNLFVQAASGGTEPVQLETSRAGNRLPSSWSPDGRFICYTETNVEDAGNIWILPVNRPKEAFPFIRTPARDGQGRFSPDGRWVAYYSEESGTGQIYVRRFHEEPAAVTKWQVSTAGGIQPLWRGDGKEIYFLAPEGKVMAAAVRLGAESIELDQARPLFDYQAPSAHWNRYEYSVSPDGQKFLLLTSAEERPGNSLTLLQNWEKALVH